MLWVVVSCSLLLIHTANSVCPRYCSCIQQTIDCSSKQLTSITNELLLQTGALQSSLINNLRITNLNLANNQLKELPAILVSESLPNLLSIDLSHNKIEEVTKIQSVVLSKHLLYLNVASNPLHHLGNDTDSVLYSQTVSHLDISNCNINSITHSGSFMYMLNLTHLNLSGNPLIVVDYLVSNTLKHLDLSSCLLGFSDKGIRDESLVNLPNLRVLNISKNAYLTRLPTSKVLSYSLRYLDSSYCALEKMDLRSFPNLQHITLKGNIIKTISNNVLSDHVDLESLDLSENSIYFIERFAFVGCKSLLKLDLSKNLLSSFDWNTLLETPRLSIFNISRNLLTTLDELPVPSLTVMDASKCEISKVNPHSLDKAVNIKYLNLSHNFFEEMPESLTTSKLLNLDLSFCRISNFKDHSNSEPSKLIMLNLMGNRLTSPFKQNVLDRLQEIKELNLLNNPWHCDCNDPDFETLWKYLSSYPQKSKYTKNLLCQSPKEQNGLTWEKSCFEHLTARDMKISKNRALFSILVPLLTLLCILAILYVIRQAYSSHQLEVQQRNFENTRPINSENIGFSQRTANLDNDLERGIQLSINEATQQAHIRELSKLPSYEEALLLPKPQSRENLNKIVKKYEETGRFGRPLSDDLSSATQNEHCVHNTSETHPSTSSPD